MRKQMKPRIHSQATLERIYTNAPGIKPDYWVELKLAAYPYAYKYCIQGPIQMRYAQWTQACLVLCQDHHLFQDGIWLSSSFKKVEIGTGIQS